MTQKVRLPDGTVANFPDDLSEKEIVASIQRTYGQPKEETGFAQRALTGLMDPIVGAGQLADRYLVNPVRQAFSPGATSMEDVVRERNADYVAPEGFDAARLAGNIANPLNWVGGGSAARLAGAGAIMGAVNPTAADLSPEQYLKEKLLGAGVGAAVGGAVGKLVPGGPVAGDAGALMEAGIQPTIGQAAGPMSYLGRIEQSATSLPLVGDVITRARNRPVQEFGEWALREATGVPGVKTLDQANQIARDAYEAVVPKLKADFDTYMITNSAKEIAAANPELTKANKKLFLRVADDLTERVVKVADKGDALKHLDSEIGALVRKYDAGDPAQQTLADAFRQLQTGFREGLAEANPQHADALKAANTMYRKLVPLNKAASRRADEVITPRNLQLELAKQAGVDASRFSNPVIDAALRTIPNTVPDSGTAGRSALIGALTGGAFVSGEAIPMIGGLAAVAAGYGRGAQRALVDGSRMANRVLVGGSRMANRVLAEIEAYATPLSITGRYSFEEGRR